LVVDRLKTISRGIIRRFGIPLTFFRASGSVYDPNSGSLVGGSVTSYQVKVLLQHYSPVLISLSQGMIEVSDRKVVGTEALFRPEPGDKVEIEAFVYRVVETKEYTLSGIWEAHLKPV
jgi:hypothetical protein